MPKIMIRVSRCQNPSHPPASSIERARASPSYHFSRSPSSRESFRCHATAEYDSQLKRCLAEDIPFNADEMDQTKSYFDYGDLFNKSIDIQRGFLFFLIRSRHFYFLVHQNNIVWNSYDRILILELVGKVGRIQFHCLSLNNGKVG